MRIIFTLALVTGLLNSVWADNKKPALAGVYVGVVQGDEARAILKADGTMIVHPSPDEPEVVMRGTWKAEGNTVTAKLVFFDGGQGTVVFHRDGADLILRKIISPDGEVDELTAPHFAKKKALADKGPAGIYTGEFDGEGMQIELQPNGHTSVRSAEDPNEGEIFTGTWKVADTGVLISVETECGDGAKVFAQITDRGFKILKVDSPDGVETYEDGARLKRQKRGKKKQTDTQ